MHHEVELAVVVDKLARRVPEGQAMEHVGGYALAIDLTARDLQAQAKKVCGCVWVWVDGRGRWVGGRARPRVSYVNPIDDWTDPFFIPISD